MSIAQAERINLRTTREAKAMIEQAAKLMGTTLSAFVLQNSYDAARRLLTEHQMLVLSNHDRDALLAALARPPKPNAALRKLMKK